MRWPAEPTQRRFPARPPRDPRFSLPPWGAGGRFLAASACSGLSSPPLAPIGNIRSSVCLSSISHSAFMGLSLCLYSTISLYKFLFLSPPPPPLVRSPVSLFLSFLHPTCFPKLLSPCLPFSSVPIILEENTVGGLYTLEIAFKLKTTTTISTSHSCRPLHVGGSSKCPSMSPASP